LAARGFGETAVGGELGGNGEGLAVAGFIAEAAADLGQLEPGFGEIGLEFNGFFQFRRGGVPLLLRGVELAEVEPAQGVIRGVVPQGFQLLDGRGGVAAPEQAERQLQAGLGAVGVAGPDALKFRHGFFPAVVVGEEEGEILGGAGVAGVPGQGLPEDGFRPGGIAELFPADGERLRRGRVGGIAPQGLFEKCRGGVQAAVFQQGAADGEQEAGGEQAVAAVRAEEGGDAIARAVQEAEDQGAGGAEIVELRGEGERGAEMGFGFLRTGRSCREWTPRRRDNTSRGDGRAWRRDRAGAVRRESRTAMLSRKAARWRISAMTRASWSGLVLEGGRRRRWRDWSVRSSSLQTV
jgi:hypothetical protein